MRPAARHPTASHGNANRRRRPGLAVRGFLLIVAATGQGSTQVNQDDPLAPYLSLVQRYRQGGLDAVRDELPNWPIERVQRLAPLVKVASRETVEVRALAVRPETAAEVKGFAGGTVHRIEDERVFEGAATLHLEQAIAEAYDGELAEVRPHVDFGRWLLDLVPGSPGPPPFRQLWHRAVVYFVSGLADPFAADDYLKRAETLFPGDPEIALARGAQLELLAIPPFSERQLPVSQGTRTERLSVMTLRQAWLVDQARRTYETIVASNPTHGEAWLRLALLRCRRGELDDAGTAAERAVREATEPTVRYLAQLVTGAVHARAEDWQAAAAAYRSALAVVPGAQAASVGLSEALFRTGNQAEAAAVLRPVLTTHSAASTSDPWWDYPAGPIWRLTPLVNELRRRIRS